VSLVFSEAVTEDGLTSRAAVFRSVAAVPVFAATDAMLGAAAGEANIRTACRRLVSGVIKGKLV
jgi:hypothetical protein